MEFEPDQRASSGTEGGGLDQPRGGAPSPQKNQLQPHLKKRWCIPPKENARFVAQMEEILDLYEKPYDPKRPVVGFDEQPQVLLEHKHPPLEMSPGQCQREDYEYVRKGTANVFCCFEPLQGKRKITVTQRRTLQDFAHQMKDLVDLQYPDAEVIEVVLDNLSSPSKAALYATFPAEEANRIAQKLNFHFTPKHGSWLNVAEIEFSIFSKQCTDRRIGGIEQLTAEATAWQDRRNQTAKPLRWQFTTKDARIKLASVYPKFSD